MSCSCEPFRLKRGLLKALAAVVLWSSISLPSYAQTSDQLSILQNLSSEQQQSILENLSSGGRSGGGSSGVTRSDRPLSQPETVRPRTEAITNRSAESVKLKADDTLILSLEIRETRSPDQSQPQSQSAAATSQTGTSSDRTAVPGQVLQTRAQEQGGERVTRTADEQKRLEDLRASILRRNPYQLDSRGGLYIPELGTILLAGFNLEEARQRIAAEWLLKDYVVNLTALPAQQDTRAGLQPFGYDLFAGEVTTFAPATDVPVPVDYALGPGDTVRVQLTGSTKGTYNLVVNRSGAINFPEIGPINVAGMRFTEVRDLIEKRVTSQLIGTQVSVTMGELRSIRVFVLGDAKQPGSYTVSGLSTITNALFVSGGIKKTGSMRNIELKRNGQTVSRLDLYDILLRGDTSGDVRLLAGDAIFINPIGPTVGVAGEVKRPAIYEFRGEVSAGQIVELAGGLNASADSTLAALTRIDSSRRKTVLDINLSGDQRNIRLSDGDLLTVHGIRTNLEDAITVSGYVYRPGAFQYRPGMRLSDAIASLDELQPGADEHYVLIRREVPPNRNIQVFSADLADAVANRGGAADIELAARDHIYVFDLQASRDRIVDPILRDLRMQSNLDQPLQAVTVSGRVKVPGQYPLEPGMRISDLIRAGGSLDDAAYGGSAELARYQVVKGEVRQTQLVNIDLARIRAKDTSADLLLQPFDRLVIKEVTDWRRDETIEILGEVRFPGIYPIRRGETLRSVLERAGGVTDLAFVEGSVFTRTALKERERQQIETLSKRMESDLAALSLTAAQETGRDPTGALAVGRSLLASLRGAEPVGRLVIDLDSVRRAAPGSRPDIILKDGDKLVVPRISQEITVLGEVQSATSHLYDVRLSRDDYVELSGGTTRRADKGRTYVVRANGSVVAKGNSWFSNTGMRPGDTIVVPFNAEYVRLLPTLTQVTQVLYNVAIAVAAVNAL